MKAATFVNKQNDFTEGLKASLKNGLILLDNTEATNIILDEIKLADLPDAIHLMVKTISHLESIIEDQEASLRAI